MSVDFVVPVNHRLKIKEILGSCLRAEKVVEHEADGDLK